MIYKHISMIGRAWKRNSRSRFQTQKNASLFEWKDTERQYIQGNGSRGVLEHLFGRLKYNRIRLKLPPKGAGNVLFVCMEKIREATSQVKNGRTRDKWWVQRYCNGPYTIWDQGLAVLMIDRK